MPTLESRLIALARSVGTDVKGLQQKTSIALPAGMPIGGHKVICTDETGAAIYANSNVVVTASSVVGVSINAANIGDTVLVQFSGCITESSWSWEPKQPIYLGPNGTLNQACPTDGFVMIVGFAVTATKMNVGLKQAIITI